MKNNYKEYLDSYAWKALKKMKLEDQPDCECCGEPATTVHHLSYERRGSERDSDIVSICERCHNECHNVNGYQIKNDEEILKRRFEDVKEELGGLDYKSTKYVINKYQDSNEIKIYKNDTLLNSLGNNLYDDGIYIYNLYDIELGKKYSRYSEEQYKKDCYNSEKEYYSSLYNYDMDEEDRAEDEFYNEFEDYEYILELHNIIFYNCSFLKVFEDDKYIIYKNYLKKEQLNILGSGYFIFKKTLYFNNIKVENIDLNYLTILKEGLIKDKNFVFLNMGILKGADSKTFYILNDNYAKDKNFVYYISRIEEPPYYGPLECEPLEGIDPNSFIIINDTYTKDKKNVYKYGEKIEGVDPKTFNVDDYE